MTVATTFGAVADLRRLAQRCLESEAPSPAEAHVLASAALDLVRALESAAAGSASLAYRAEGCGMGSGAVETSVALERALEVCAERLRLALAELDVLRASR